MIKEKTEWTLPAYTDAKDIFEYVYTALREKGHNPVMQMIGYLTSGDPTYITSYKNARTMIRRAERDDLLEMLIKYYAENELKDE